MSAQQKEHVQPGDAFRRLSDRGGVVAVVSTEGERAVLRSVDKIEDDGTLVLGRKSTVLLSDLLGARGRFAPGGAS